MKERLPTSAISIPDQSKDAILPDNFYVGSPKTAPMLRQFFEREKKKEYAILPPGEFALRCLELESKLFPTKFYAANNYFHLLAKNDFEQRKAILQSKLADNSKGDTCQHEKPTALPSFSQSAKK
ncbi:MAG: hypothetical protein JO149_04060 [Gammaproteobacteria bacterium]|nr:hypothetical protein [Gammaproteobacteria bacterium]